ncbi:MAG: prolipoprotein diacylglyceryl transferase [Phycisphaerae bacterium]|nr:prolipoprotein diacylglyceryl transferase [Phycisphaerae bacterium]
MIARLLYGLLFCVLLPAMLIAWAWRLDHLHVAPELAARPTLGVALALVGFLVVAWAMLVLRTVGGGLPMNAFPPPRYVARGPYAIVSDPIYLGATLVVAGVALADGSGAGWRIVAPALLVAATALSLGYERPDLDRRFGTDRAKPWTALPPESDARPTARDAIGTWLGLFVPWLVGYEWIGHLPVAGAIDLMAGPEASWPVWDWTSPIYSSVYPVAVAAPWLAASRGALRRWRLDAQLGIALGFLAFLVLPFIATPRPFDPNGVLAFLQTIERGDGVGGRAAFPSFHTFWACMAALAIGERYPRARFALLVWALLVGASCATTGMHSVLDVAAGIVLTLVARARAPICRSLIAASEAIANGWREWRLGRMRVIAHGFFAGAAATVGVLVIGGFADSHGAAAIAIVALASLVGAALWGQFWVGSATLLRPFGYFGSVLGVAAAGAVLAFAGRADWSLVAAVAIAAPWIQAIGRLRCLMQGCCHGHRVERGGMVYRHPRSRVVALANLGGVPVHPTPLYSILANLVLGALLVRLASVGAPASMVVGAYLFLAGCVRFVEESRRGEPHTPVRGGLRLYQWCAIALAVLGVALTTIASPALGAPTWPSPTTLALAVAIGGIHVVAMGVDWPEGTRRFSRLV